MDKEKKNQFLLIVIGIIILLGILLISTVLTPRGKSAFPATVDNQVIPIDKDIVFDECNTIVSIVELDGANLKFTVQNNGDKDMIYYIDSVDINNCRVYYSGAYTKPITAGNKAVDSYNIAGANAYGITEVKAIDVKVSVFDTDLDLQKAIHITTGKDDGEAYAPDVSAATLVYSDDNFELFVVMEGDSLENYNWLIHNKAAEELTVQAQNIAVNGVMSENMHLYFNVNPYGYDYTDADANTSTTIWSALHDEIKEKGFDNVESIVATLQVWIGPTGGDKNYYEVKRVNIDAEK